MAVFTYQVIFSEELEYKEELMSLLKEAFQDNYEELERDILNDYIYFRYIIKIDENKYIIGFELDFDPMGLDITNIINSLNEKLSDHDKILVVFKFYDENLLELLKGIYLELFKIEMKLREIVSLIFIDTYKDDYYNLSKDIELRLQFDGRKNLQKNQTQKTEFLKNRLENEFFHILFSDYAKLTVLKDLKNKDLYLIAAMSNNFDEFKDYISKRGVIKGEYFDFLNSIKEIMNNLEIIRNCVAHNRTPSPVELENYNKSKTEIEEKIDEFIEGLASED